MKRFFILTAAWTALAGCQSVDSNVTDISPEAHGRESLKAIEFVVRDTSATKGPTPITSLSQFNVTATSGSAGSEASKLDNVVFSDNNKSGVFKSDAVWPASDQKYHFYASNVAMTHTSSGQTVAISSIDKDVVCAYLASPTYKVKNALTFNHILARVGTVSFTNLGLCSNVKLSMKYSGSGTYNIRTGVWSGVGGQSTKELTTADNDFWIIPGSYDATLTYTDANGNPQSKTISQKFLSGKVNNISARLDGSVVVKTEEEYEAPTFTLGTISDVPAGGGDSGVPSVTAVGQRKRVRKTLADGTVKYDPDWTAVSNPNYTIQYGKTLSSLSDNCPSYHGNNLGTTAKARTKLGDVYVRVKIGGKTTDKTLEVWQQANEETLGTLSVKTFSYSPKVGAAGGTASPSVTYELPYSWTSGSKGNYTSGAKLSYSTVTDNAGATLNASTGVVTWTTNSGNERSETERVAVSLKGKNNTKDAATTQSGDSVIGYDTPTVTLSYSGTPIAYNSTSAISPTLTVKQKVYYASGASDTKTLSPGDYTVSYSGSVTGLNVNSSTGAVTPSSNAGSVIAAKTEYTTPSVSLSYNNIAYTGGSSSPSLSYSQTKTSYTEGRNSTSARTATVTASVTAHSKSASATASVKQNADGGKAQTTTTSTITSGATSITYSGYESGFTRDGGTVTAKSNVGSGGGVSYGDPVVSFTSPTTTIGYSGGNVTCNEATYSQTKTTAARNSTSSRSITVTASVTLNGKKGTQSATCTQNGDPGASKKDETISTEGSVSYSSSGTGFSNSGRTISASSNAGETIPAKTVYNDPTVSLSYNPATLLATGGTSTPSVTYSQTGTSYSEGRSSTSSRPGSITASVILNGKTGSKTINFTQSGDDGKAQTTSAITPVTSGGTISFKKLSGSTYLNLNTTNGNVSASENTSTSTRSITVQATVTVNKKPGSASATVTQDEVSVMYKLTCTGTAITETVGETKSFSATVKKQKYVNGNASGSASTILSGVSYVIGNSSIATLASGKVTGVSEGTTKIYATATIEGVTYNSKDNEDSGISVTVKNPDVITYKLTCTGTAVSVEAGKTASFTPKVTYYKITNGVSDSGTDVTSKSTLTYSTGNSSVATVPGSYSGKTVTGVAAGTTKIYASYSGISSKDNGDSGISVTVTKKDEDEDKYDIDIE